MYIQPTANLYLLKGCPCDADYTNTLWFSRNNQQSQYSYFSSLVKGATYMFTNFNTIRVNKNKIRVPINSERLYDINYIMFQNAHFGGKWFYAFVTQIDYISNGVSEITFEIDKIQTWLFDFELNETFVEREHTLTDEIGDNIVPETFDLGEKVYNNYDKLYPERFDEYIFVLAYVSKNNNVISGNSYDNIYSGATLYLYHNTTAGITALNTKLGASSTTPANVLGVYVIPKILYNNNFEDGDVAYGGTTPTNIKFISNLSGDETIDGYTVRNKKLYTYPYNYFCIDNASGDEMALRYEFFKTNNALTSVTLIIEGCITQPVQVVVRPTNYKGVVNTSDYKYTLNTEMLALSGYPQCCYTFDGYATWVGQNLFPLAVSTLKTLGVSTVAGIFAGGWQGMALTGIGVASNLLSEGYKASTQENQTRGTLNNGSVNIASNKQGFYYGRKSINKQTAKIIDDFFTRYGYAVKEVKKPTLYNRSEWTYIKTVGCTIKGTMPTDDERTICSIFDKGLTFWANPEHVGDYSLDNGILVG